MIFSSHVNMSACIFSIALNACVYHIIFTCMCFQELEGKNNEIHDLQEKMEHEMLGRDSENEGLKSALMDMMEDLNEKEIQVL